MKYKPALYNNNNIKTEAGEKKNKTEHQKKPTLENRNGTQNIAGLMLY